MDLFVLPFHLYSYILRLLPPDRRLLLDIRGAAWASALPRLHKTRIVEIIEDILGKLIDLGMITKQLMANTAWLEKKIEDAHENAPAWYRRQIVEAQRGHIYKSRVSSHGLWVKHVPGCFITAELSMAAVLQYSHAMRWDPDALITADLAMTAVQQDGEALEHVPNDLRHDEQIALAAVRQTYAALEWVVLKTPAVCKAAAEQELLTKVQLN